MINKKRDLIEKILNNYNNNKYNLSDIKGLILNDSKDSDKNTIKKYWKKNVNKLNEINLYFHIPYCESKCYYCREDSDKVPKGFNQDKYIDSIIENIHFFKDTFKNKKFNSLYIGGGTPSILTEKNIKKLLTSIFENFKFKKDSEKTFESNPKSMTKSKLEIIKEIGNDNGINRISFGIQSTNNNVLSAVGRVHPPFNKIKELIKHTNKLGFKVINVDLIMGLLKDSYKIFKQSIEDLMKLDVSRIWIYPLNPTQNYLEMFYQSNIEYYFKIWNQYTKKFDYDDLNSLVSKYNYNLNSDINFSNQMGFDITKKSMYDFNNLYELFPSIPTSCLGFGLRSQSHIISELFYKKINNGYEIKKISKDDEIIYHLIRILKSDSKMDTSEINKIFSIDFNKKYHEQLKFLKTKGIIYDKKDFIKFKTDSQKKRFKHFLYLLSKNQLTRMLNKIT
ncbi:MAG: radical SAM protein [Candidatus Woesearchaeota archaeon]